MKTLWLLLAIAVPLQLIHAQEVKYAPTVEQCRADQRLWLSKLEQPNSIGIPNVDDALGEIFAVMVRRLVGFLERHNLMDQFLGEDAQGKR